MEEEKPKMPKVPSRFIETKLARNMKTGQGGYVMKDFSFYLDEHDYLWVDGSSKFNELLPGKEFFDDEDENIEIDPQSVRMTLSQDSVRIERLEDGFKAYLYEFYEATRKHVLRCSSADQCAKGVKVECTCKGILRRAIFRPEIKISESRKQHMLPVVAFDEPIELINSADNLKDLTAENVKNYTLRELSALLVDAEKDGNFEAAILIRDELDKRK